MESFYFSASSIRDLSIAIIWFLCALYLFSLKKKPASTLFLAGYFSLLFLNAAANFVRFSVLDPLSNTANLLQRPLLPLALVCIIQFAYRFRGNPWPREARVLLILSGLLALAFPLWEISQLLAYTPEFKPNNGAYVINASEEFYLADSILGGLDDIAGYLWAGLVLLRQSVLLSRAVRGGQLPAEGFFSPGRFKEWLVLVWKPLSEAASGARLLALALMAHFIPELPILDSLDPSLELVLIMVPLLFFVVVYLNYSPQPSTVQVKLVGVTLVTLLMAFSLISGVVVSLQQAAYFNDLKDKVDLLKPQLKSNSFTAVPPEVSYIIAAPYKESIYSSNYKTLFQQDPTFDVKSYNKERAKKRESYTDSFIKYYQDQDPSLTEAQARQQAVDFFSQTGGNFSRERYFSKGGATTRILYKPIPNGPVDTIPPGYTGNPFPVHYYYQFRLTAGTAQIFNVGFDYLAIRKDLNDVIAPLIWILLGATLFVLLVFPLFFRRSVMLPLNSLLSGVKGVNGGDLAVQVPVKVEDEIGFLTRNFNDMTQSLKTAKQQLEEYAGSLEEKVAERTAELGAANQAILRLNERLKAENMRMSAELDITRRIQQMILPRTSELENNPDLDIAAFMRPADEVGGDYYDILVHPDGKIKIGIGDVTGHGLESGVLMLLVQSAIRTLDSSDSTSLDSQPDPARFLGTLNRSIFDNIQRMQSEKNLSLSLLDYHKGVMRLSGQHESTLVVRAESGEIEVMDTMDLGFPVGLIDDIESFVSSVDISLNRGDVVVLYTDGIPEAENPAKEQYGLERMCEVLKANRQAPAYRIKEAIIEDLMKFIGEQTVFDDVTLVVLKQR